MADHNLKLVISADTSDAEKKLKDVGKVKVDPVKVDVTADKVTVDAPKVEPVKVPVTADKVTVDAPKVEPVKVPVETPVVKPKVVQPDPVKPKVVKPDPIKVQAKVEPDPVKPNVEQPKPVTIKSIFDSSAIGTGINALKRLREVANSVMAAFGLFGLAVNGVMAVVSGIKALHEWMNRAQTKAKELREELERTNLSDKIAREAESYERLNRALAEAARLEKERNDIIDGRRVAERSLEDAKAEQSKQLEIGKLDPAAKDYDAKKSEIERRYQLEAIERNRNRAGEDARRTASDLYAKAESKDKEARRLEAKYNEALKTEDVAIERNWKAGMDARSGDDGAVKRKEEAENQWKAAHDAAKRIKEAMEQASKEAVDLRNRAAEMAGSNLAANIKADAERRDIENRRREEESDNAKNASDEAKKASDEEKRGKNRIEDAELERRRQESLAALDPKSKNYEAEKMEVENVYRFKQAENKVARAENETDRKVAEEELAALTTQINNEKRQFNAREDIRKASELESFGNRAGSFDAVSQNRLTAIGLGSGVSASGSVQSDVRRLVDLLRQNVEATKNIKLEVTESEAVYGE